MPPQAVKNNGSVYVHMVLAKEGASIQRDEPAFSPVEVAYYSFRECLLPGRMGGRCKQ